MIIDILCVLFGLLILIVLAYVFLPRLDFVSIISMGFSIFAILLNLSVIGFVLYIIWHFANKYW